MMLILYNLKLQCQVPSAGSINGPVLRCSQIINISPKMHNRTLASRSHDSNET
uniref:Uncharacterized protein n=1 Tax=Rhizophora mucronata TaxID=61149 RepID=A0A2P2IH72_RHIMU